MGLLLMIKRNIVITYRKIEEIYDECEMNHFRVAETSDCRAFARAPPSRCDLDQPVNKSQRQRAPVVLPLVYDDQVHKLL